MFWPILSHQQWKNLVEVIWPMAFTSKPNLDNRFITYEDAELHVGCAPFLYWETVIVPTTQNWIHCDYIIMNNNVRTLDCLYYLLNELQRRMTNLMTWFADNSRLCLRTYSAVPIMISFVDASTIICGTYFKTRITCTRNWLVPNCLISLHLKILSKPHYTIAKRGTLLKLRYWTFLTVYIKCVQPFWLPIGKKLSDRNT